MTAQIISCIRTTVPAWTAGAIVWLAAHAGIVIDEQTSQAATLAATGIVVAVWYALVRQLERRWPAVGWLLGAPKAPSYQGAR